MGGTLLFYDKMVQLPYKVKRGVCMSGHHLRKHGLSTTKIYQVFWGMNNRCHHSESEKNSTYRENNITVCDEWRGFDNFLTFKEWADNSGYSEGLQLDRIDTNKGYEPSNCRWVEPVVNCRNQNIRKDNTSGIKGVNKCKKSGKWTVRISVDGKRKFLGRFDTLDEAKLVREKAELEMWS